jgi:hypothetical protein
VSPSSSRWEPAQGRSYEALHSWLPRYRNHPRCGVPSRPGTRWPGSRPAGSHISVVPPGYRADRMRSADAGDRSDDPNGVRPVLRHPERRGCRANRRRARGMGSCTRLGQASSLVERLARLGWTRIGSPGIFG